MQKFFITLLEHLVLKNLTMVPKLKYGIIPTLNHKLVLITLSLTVKLLIIESKKYEKRALITGISGQDGPYLAKFLLEKNYDVYGLLPRRSKQDLYNLEYLNIKNDIDFVIGDVTDQNCMHKTINKIKPHEIYNLAAQSFVGNSWDLSSATTDVNAVGPLNILNAIKSINKKIKFYQASTSELYGNSAEKIQNENTRFEPTSPYAISKLYAYWITVNFRQSYNMFCCNGILFNHESPIRGLEFVTRKITDAVAKIKFGKQKKISLGNINSKRDWGFAGDYVEAMWLMMQHEKPSDYVIATNKQYSIKDFLKLAFKEIGIKNWEDYISINKNFKRPVDVTSLRGDFSKAKMNLGWYPKTSFEDLVRLMVREDLKRHKDTNINLKIIENLKSKKYLKNKNPLKRVSA